MNKKVLKSSPLLSATSKIGPAGASPPSSGNLGFGMHPQLQTQWCWSAVAVSTSLYYNAVSKWTQCTLVEAELNAVGCCQNGSSSQCNQPWRLDAALVRTGNLDRWGAGAPNYSDVQQQINNSKPLGARVGWSGGGGHFVIIDGYEDSGLESIYIKDPWYGSSTYPYAVFKSSYQGTGSWTHTYYTKP